jgi:DNA repair exonuclease SbcCD ATPase subunit
VNAPRPLGRDEADQLLTGIGAAHDRIAAAMYAVDVHPGLALLRGGTLTGVTESRWRALGPEIDLLWVHFAALGQSLEEARAIRARHRPGDQGWVALDRLLREPSVELAADGMPVTTTLPGTAVSRVTLGDLAGQIERRCAAVAGHLSEVDAAFSAVVARLAPVTAAVDSVLALATELGEPAVGQDLRVSLERAQRIDLGDPLTAAQGGRLQPAAEARWIELANQAERARQLLADRARVRGGYPELRAALTALVEDLAAAEDAVAQTQRQVTEKIAEPGLAAVPTAAANLRSRLSELDRLHDRARTEATLWRRLVDDLHTVEQSARQARERARQLRENAEGLLARRDELRGRLNAYRAKAAARGLAEHPELTTGYAQARDLLFTAPCDLRASTRSVHGYQQTLAAILSSESSFDSAKDSTGVKDSTSVNDSTGANDSTNDEGRPA